MSTAVHADLVAFAHRLAEASGEIIRHAAREPRVVHAKADASPVTAIDRAVEQRLRDLIAHEYPDHGVLGEEFDPHNLDAEHVWVLDPIDGTVAFMVGLPAYGTLIALTRGGAPVLGIIDQPVTRERWVGIDGDGSYYNGERIRVRECPQLGDAMLCTTSREYFRGTDLAAFERLVGATRWTVFGGNCYVFGQLAAGFADIAFETRVGAWDYCALVPVVGNAGGIMSTWTGEPLTLDTGTRIIACGDARLHAAALECLANS